MHQMLLLQGKNRAISLLQLLIIVAWINFINLATARALNRAKEVGVRKTLGSSKQQLVGQFVFEALFASFLAALGAIAVVFFFSGWIKMNGGKWL